MDTGNLAGRCFTLAMKGRKILTKQGVVVDDNTLPSCCESCHEDIDNGTGDFLDITHNGVLYQVCCRVSNWWKDSIVEFAGVAM